MAICGVEIAECECSIEEGKCDGRHFCNGGNCGGSWRTEGFGIMGEPILIPSTMDWQAHVDLTDRLVAAGPERARLIMIGLGML